MSDGIADIYEVSPDAYYLDFGDTATWLAVGTYVDGEPYCSNVYSRYKFDGVSEKFNCYAVDNVLSFEVAGKAIRI